MWKTKVSQAEKNAKKMRNGKVQQMFKSNKYIKNRSVFKHRLHGPLDRSEQVKYGNI
jgi:hypothetical protein